MLYRRLLPAALLLGLGTAPALAEPTEDTAARTLEQNRRVVIGTLPRIQPPAPPREATLPAPPARPLALAAEMPRAAHR